MRTSDELIADKNQQVKALTEAFPGIAGQVTAISAMSFEAGYAKCQEDTRDFIAKSRPND